MKWGFFQLVLVVGLCGAAACGRPEQEYQARLREIEGLRGQMNALTAERNRLNETLSGLRTSNEAMAGRLRELGQDVRTTQNELEAARRREEELRRLQQQSE